MTGAPERAAAISDQSPRQVPDVDPAETQEWRDSLDGVVDHARDRARHLMLSVLQRARERQVDVPGLGSTDYINTIPSQSEPSFPGDERIERRIRAYIRWNAAIMVHRAQRPGIGVGGHISTYASSASLTTRSTTRCPRTTSRPAARTSWRTCTSAAGPWAATCRPAP
jgi:pyruvate dehydrogenase E1 component